MSGHPKHIEDAIDSEVVRLIDEITTTAGREGVCGACLMRDIIASVAATMTANDLADPDDIIGAARAGIEQGDGSQQATIQTHAFLNRIVSERRKGAGGRDRPENPD